MPRVLLISASVRHQCSPAENEGKIAPPEVVRRLERNGFLYLEQKVQAFQIALQWDFCMGSLPDCQVIGQEYRAEYGNVGFSPLVRDAPN